MGRVWLANDARLNRPVALKEAIRGGAVAARLVREAQVTAGLEHPGIVAVHDAGTTAEGVPYYTMRIVRGKALDRVLRERSSFTERLALVRPFLEVCYAVAYAHSRGVLHRDLKPANILIGAFGEVQVADWGLATRIGEAEEPGDASGAEPSAPDAPLTHDGQVLGTPAYMSPEQARGEVVGPPSDVWGLGAILYEILAGAPPLGRCDSPSALERARNAAVIGIETVAPEVPRELITILRRALAPASGDRYPDAGALATDVASWLDGRPVATHVYTARELFLRLVRAWRAPLVVASVAVALLSALAALSFFRVRAERDRAREAEVATQAALRSSDENLARALLAQAHAAMENGANAHAEVLATRALSIAESPEARGVLATVTQSARPARVGEAAAPPCRGMVFLAVDDVVCADDRGVLRVTGGVERWRWEGAVRDFRLEGDRVIVHTTPDAIPLSLEDGTVAGAAGGSYGLPRPSFLGPPDSDSFSTRIIEGLCGAQGIAGIAGATEPPEQVVLCTDGRLGRALPGVVPRDGPKLTVPDFVVDSVMDMAVVGRRLVVSGPRTQVYVVDLDDLRTWVSVPETVRGLRGLRFSEDGGRLVEIADRGDLVIRSLPELGIVARIPAGEAVEAGFLPGGDLVVVQGGRATRWRLPEYARTSVLRDSEGVTSVRFSPDGRSLVSGHAGSRVNVWDLDRGIRQAQGAGLGTIKSVAFSADGATLFSTETGPGQLAYALRRFDATTGARLWSSSAAVTGAHAARSYGADPAVAETFSGRRLVALRSGHLLVAGYVGGPLMVAPELDREVLLADCAATMWVDLSARPDGLAAIAMDGEGGAWRIDDGAPPRCTPLAAKVEVAVELGSDGDVYTGRRDALRRLSPEGVERWSVPHASPGPLDIRVSPDGRWVATGGRDHSARVYDTGSGALRAVLPSAEERVVALDFSPDSAVLATGSWDGSVRLHRLDVLDATPAALAARADESWRLSVEEALAR